ncbi:hypothetical protein A134_11935 [Vibrio crassostreae 9CS106]|nr:hypothetical protein A134_11935 [Vibrio crassostreae 9CS106]
MSIEKFIDLINNKRLYMTPLSYYQKTDPFEGFTPKIMFELTTDIALEQIKELEQRNLQAEKTFRRQVDSGLIKPNEEQLLAISKIKPRLEQEKANIIPRHNKISKSTCVHCWYHSNSESEAMWKLYSDSGKGIAIKTTVASLESAINLCEPTVPLLMGRVKYLDFLCDKLTPQDCLTDGVTSPLLKRKEYAHENEVRLYSVPQGMNAEEWAIYDPSPILVDIDVSTLIEAVYISPYIDEPFTSSVYTLCELFDIPKRKVINSKLLDNYEEVLLGYTK